MRNANWKHDERVKKTLEEYSRQGLQRTEILSFVTRDFVDGLWSTRPTSQLGPTNVVLVLHEVLGR